MTAAIKFLPCPYCQQAMPCDGDHAYAKAIPRLPVCSFCAAWLDGDDDARRTVRFDGGVEWECGACRVAHDEDEAEHNRGDLEVEEFFGS